MPGDASLARRLARRLAGPFWLAVLVAHVIAAAIWWWMMPAGFPLAHPRFWLHRVVPFVLVAFAVAFVVPRTKPLRPALLAAIPATYLAAAIAGRMLFPATLRTLWFAPLTIGLVLFAIWAVEHRAQWRRALLVAPLGAALGTVLALAQDAPSPSTHPANIAFPTDASRSTAASSFQAGPLSLWIDPMLAFISRSPDGCWTVLASTADRLGPVDERSSLATHVDDRGALHVEAITDVPHAIYSHLNSYSAIAIHGHRRLFLAFSPAPDARIEVLPSDYPSGRPSRFAYVDADRVFHVVEASDAEKGPFANLASGRLAPGDPLAITLYDEQAPIARITFDDFAAQASTELSPTAGWSVPQNAIQFSLDGDVPTAPASMFLTLAGTGVGRGFDSVGHAPGVYRNRILVEKL